MTPNSNTTDQLICDSLSTFYAQLLQQTGNPNGRKIALVMKRWIYSFLFAYRNQIPLPPGTLDIEHCIERFYGSPLTRNEIVSPTNPITRSLIVLLSYIYPQRRLRLYPEKGSYLSFFYYYLSCARISRLELPPSDYLRCKFYQYAECILDKHTLDTLFSALPQEFFSNPITVSSFPKTITGSPLILFKPFFFRILFINSELRLIGHVHGGVYGETFFNADEVFEVSISDEYYNWGFSPNSICQTRFLQSSRPLSSFLSVSILAPRIPNPYVSYFTPALGEIYASYKANIPDILNSLSAFNATLLLHPADQIDHESAQTSFRDTPEHDKSSTLYILPSPCQTTLYQLLYESRPFLMILDRNLQAHLTPGLRNFLKCLLDNDMLFFYDNLTPFVSRVKNLFSSSSHNMPFDKLRSSLFFY